MESSSSSSAVPTRGERIRGYMLCGWIVLVPAVGFAMMMVGNGWDEVGFNLFIIYFIAPWILMGLYLIVGILLLLLYGFCEIARRPGVNLVKVMQGLTIITTAILFVLAIVDIVKNCEASMFFFLIFSMNFVLIVFKTLHVVFDAVKLACIMRWGITLEAKVLKRRRRPIRNNDNDGEITSYKYEVLVSYDVEASHQSCWRTFGYQGVSGSTTEAVSASDEDEGQVVTCMGSNDGAMHQVLDEGRPVQPGLVQEKSNENAIWSTQQRIQKWLEVNESIYRYRNRRNIFVEVSILPGWSKVAVTTDTLSDYHPCGHAIAILLLSGLTTVISIPGVFLPREIYFKDDGSCTLWHVEASYILLSILISSVMAFALILGEESVPEESVSRLPGDNERSDGQELPIVRQSTFVTAATDDETASTSDLHTEEDTLHSIT